MTTRADLRTVLRTQLASSTVWPDSSLNDWLNAAIEEYSRYFPRLYVQTHVAADDPSGLGRTFTLNDAAKGVSRVEVQNSDGTPRRALLKVDLDSPEIRYQLYGTYAEERTPGLTQAGSVVLAQTLLNTETLYIYYSAEHTLPTQDSSVLSVPDQDLPLLRAYILWQAALKVAMDETASPNTTTMMLSMLGSTATQASNAYQKLLFTRQRALQDSAVTPGWWTWDAVLGRIY